MNHRVQDYLIRAHNKVIAHQIVEASSLTQPKRERIQRGLAHIEADIENIVADGASGSMQLAQAHEPAV